MSDKISIGGTANIRVASKTDFAVAMTGVFDGGVYAKMTNVNETPDGKKLYALRPYFVTDDGSYLYTEDKSVHVLLIEGAVYYA